MIDPADDDLRIVPSHLIPTGLTNFEEEDVQEYAKLVGKGVAEVLTQCHTFVETVPSLSCTRLESGKTPCFFYIYNPSGEPWYCRKKSEAAVQAPDPGSILKGTYQNKISKHSLADVATIVSELDIFGVTQICATGGSEAPEEIQPICCAHYTRMCQYVVVSDYVDLATLPRALTTHSTVVRLFQLVNFESLKSTFPFQPLSLCLESIGRECNQLRLHKEPSELDKARVTEPEHFKLVPENSDYLVREGDLFGTKRPVDVTVPLSTGGCSATVPTQTGDHFNLFYVGPG